MMTPSLQRAVRRLARRATAGRAAALDSASLARRVRERLAASGIDVPTAFDGLPGRTAGYGTGPTSTPTSTPTPSARTNADGTVHRGRFASPHGERDWRLFVPATVEAGTAAPLLVMLHGCTQDADDFARGTRMDAAAAEHRCLVLYPEQCRRANPQRCWNWFKHTHQSAARGEPSVLLALIEQVAAAHGVDRQRVFVAGLSAGGAMAAILGSVAPAVFAGVGVHSGLGAGSASDLPSALAAMQGQGAPLAPGSGTPTIVVHGDADATVHPSNGHAITAARTHDATRWTRRTRQADGNGRRVMVTAWDDRRTGTTHAEHWAIDGAGHAWSGGDPAGSYTDASGPDASRIMLDFFLHRSRADRRAA